MEKAIGYTIKSTSKEGIYYLVNGWYKHFAFWIRQKDYDFNNEWYFHVISFKTIGSAKTSLKKLLKIMPDYSTDKFTLCGITENEKIIDISNI